MQEERRPESYWHLLVLQFRKNRIAMVGLVIIAGFFVVAAAADLIANDKPLLMKYAGKMYFPALMDYAVRLGISRWDPQFQNIVYKEFAKTNCKDGDWAAFPLIPYSPNEVNLSIPLRRPSELHFFG